MSKYYKVSITQFEGKEESLTAQAIYEQTTEALDIRRVIEAVNADAPLTIEPIPAPRAPRSDKGKKRLKFAPTAELQE